MTAAAYAALVRRTPLVPAPALDERVLLKLEHLQRGGSFKLRGAAARLDALAPEERRRGVVAASAGNHGLGVALAGRHLGVPVTVFVPETSPDVKRRGIAALGAQVRVGGATYDVAERAARAHADATGAVFVSPFADPHVIRGNGALLGEELLEQRPDVTQVVCPVGGGGLVGGLAETLSPRGVAVIGVQPAGNCAMRRSLELGRALTEYEGDPTLAEGCEGAVAEVTYELCRRHDVRITLVDERAIRAAIAFAWQACGLAIEPSAAVALAGVRTGVVQPAARGVTVVVISGGNVDPDVLDAALREGP